jgi:predicted urease superfamily metal-dependent hydrolase
VLLLLLQVGLSANILQGTNKQSDLLQLLQDCKKIWEARRVYKCGQIIEKHTEASRKRMEATAVMMRVAFTFGQDPWDAVSALTEQQLEKMYRGLANMVRPDNMTKKITAVLRHLVPGEARCSAADLLGRDAAKEVFGEAMKALGNALELCKTHAAKPN